MSRLFSILFLSIGGYYVVKKRYVIMNYVLKNADLRRFLVSTIFHLPGLRNKMMSTMFSKSPIKQ